MQDYFFIHTTVNDRRYLEEIFLVFVMTEFFVGDFGANISEPHIAPGISRRFIYYLDITYASHRVKFLLVI